jgi:hypothetical protein
MTTTTRVIRQRTGGLDRRPFKTRTRIKHERMYPFVKVTYVCSFCMFFYSQNLFVICGQRVVSIPPSTETRGLEMLWLDVVVILLLVAHSPIL